MKLTKKLFIAIMTMALLVVTFSASTFAWFTLGQESKIDTVKVNVMAGAGMEVSLDGKKWQNNISVADLLESNAKDLSDITSSNGLDFFKIGALGYENADNTHYLTLELYVRLTTDSTTQNVEFDGVMLEKVESSTEIDFEADATKQWLCDVTFSGEKSYTEGTKYNFDALNATKMSFQANNTESTKKFAYESTKGTNQGDVSLSGTSYAYAVAKKYTVPANFADGTNNVPTYLKQADLTAAINEAATAEEKKLAVTVLDDSDFKSNTDFISLYGAAAQGTEGEAGYVPAGKLYGLELSSDYKYAKLTVRIWIEGWDADCINAILDQNTSFNFTLKAWKKQA